MSIVPLRAVTEEVRTGALAFARIKGYPLIRETGWVYRSDERVPRPLQEMMATLSRIAPNRYFDVVRRLMPLVRR
jgi:hypothetical protein